MLTEYENIKKEAQNFEAATDQKIKETENIIRNKEIQINQIERNIGIDKNQINKYKIDIQKTKQALQLLEVR